MFQTASCHVQFMKVLPSELCMETCSKAMPFMTYLKQCELCRCKILYSDGKICVFIFHARTITLDKSFLLYPCSQSLWHRSVFFVFIKPKSLENYEKASLLMSSDIHKFRQGVFEILFISLTFVQFLNFVKWAEICSQEKVDLLH